MKYFMFTLLILSVTACSSIKVAPAVISECSPTYSNVILEQVKEKDVKELIPSITFVYQDAHKNFALELMCILKEQAVNQVAKNKKVSFINFYVKRNMSLFHFIPNPEDNVLIAFQAAKSVSDGTVAARMMVMYPLESILKNDYTTLTKNTVVLDQRGGALLEDKYLQLLLFLTNDKLLTEEK